MAGEADTSDIPNLVETLTTLALQIQDSNQKLRSAREEISRLREENVAVTTRLGRRDQRVGQLETECDGLSQEIQRLRMEALRRDWAAASRNALSTNG